MTKDGIYATSGEHTPERVITGWYLVRSKLMIYLYALPAYFTQQYLYLVIIILMFIYAATNQNIQLLSKLAIVLSEFGPLEVNQQRVRNGLNR